MDLTRALLSAGLLYCSAAPQPEPLAVSDPPPTVIYQPPYARPITLHDLLDETSEIRTADHALLMVTASWCNPCHELAPYLENIAGYARQQGLSPSQLYFAQIDVFDGDLYGLLDDWVLGMPTIIYLQSENGFPSREAGRIEPEPVWASFIGAGLTGQTELIKIRIAGIVTGLIGQQQ